MNTIPHRIIIYSKDIEKITGCGERTARRIMSCIRKKTGRGRGSFVTIEEFCSYTGLKEEDVVVFFQ
jgi:hypothetical protein